MRLHIAWKAPDIEKQVQSLVIRDDVPALTALTSALTNAASLWKSWCIMGMGQTIAIDPDGGRAAMPVDAIADLEDIRAKYATAVEGRVAVGVGTTLREADRALKAALLRGGDRVVLYVPELEEEIEEAEKPEEKSFLKSEGAVPRLKMAAFRHRSTGQVVETGSHHDITDFPEDADLSHWEEGFTTREGQFLNRQDARAYVEGRLQAPPDGMRKSELRKSTRRWQSKSGKVSAVLALGPGVVAIHEWSARERGHTVAALQELRQKHGQIHAVGIGSSPSDPSWTYWAHMKSKGLIDSMEDDEGRTIEKSELRKADGPSAPQPMSPPANPGGGGFSGAAGPGAPAAAASPIAEASEHSQGEAMRALVDEQSSPEMTHAAKDFEDQLHQQAQQQEAKDQADSGKAEIRQQVVQILMQVRQYAPQMAQLKQAAPELYQAMMGTVQALMLTAHALVDDEAPPTGEQSTEMQKSEKPKKDCKHFHVPWRGKQICIRCKQEHKADDRGSVREGSLKKSEFQFGRPDFHKRFPASEDGYAYHGTNTERAYQIAQQGLLVHRPGEYTDQDCWPDGATNKRNYFSPMAHATASFLPEDGQPALLRVHTSKHPIKRESTGDLYSVKPVPPEHIEVMTHDGTWHPIQQALGGALEKGKLPLPENKPRTHHVHLPVGSSRGGKVKVFHPEDNKQGWVSVRAGQVLSDDGHPISSRNAGGR